jgi:hypothetical protein
VARKEEVADIGIGIVGTTLSGDAAAVPRAQNMAPDLE